MGQSQERGTQQTMLKKGVIDFIIIRSDIVQHVESMTVIEGRINVLTKIIKKKHKADIEIK